MASTRIRVLVLLALALGGYKVPQASAGGQHGPESGRFVDGVYTNEYFGFSYPLGGSWFVNDLLKKVEHPGTVLLLGVDRHAGKPLRERIVVLADKANGYHPPLASVSEYVSKLAHSQTQVQRRELLRDAYAVDCGGRRCYRADYKENYSGGSVYRSFVATELRGFLLSWTFVANSQENLDLMVDSLHQMSFSK